MTFSYELEVQKYLRIPKNTQAVYYNTECEGDPDTWLQPISVLEMNYAITTKTHPEHPNLILFKYNQIYSDFKHQIVRECRGLILDSADNWNVVCYPFQKFFNNSEPLAANIQWETAKVQTKLDGSLCSLFSYRGNWMVATSGSPDGGGNVHDYPITFSDLFWETFNAKGYRLPLEGNTYMFELTSYHNRVVVNYKEPNLTLIGIRNNTNGQELPVAKYAKWFGYTPVREYSMSTLDGVLEACNVLNPLEQEGYVVVDANFNRIKIKSPKYVTLHHLKDGITSRRRLLEVIQKEEISEVLSYFPELEPEIIKLTVLYEQLIYSLTRHYERIKVLESQKEFALEAVKSKHSSALFAIRRGQVGSIKEYLSQIDPKRLLEVLDGLQAGNE